jgi:hypothetical protein
MNIFKPSSKVRLIDLKAVSIQKNSQIHTQNGMLIQLSDTNLYNLLKARKGDTLMKNLTYRLNIHHQTEHSLSVWNEETCLFCLVFTCHLSCQSIILKRLALQKPFNH